MPWRRPFREPGVYNFYASTAMISTVLGVGLIMLGLFITWRVQAASRAIMEVEAHLRQHDQLGAKLLDDLQEILRRLP